MKEHKSVKSVKGYLVIFFLVFGIIFGILGRQAPHNPGDTSQIAGRIERSLARKTAELEEYAATALSQDVSAWMKLGEVDNDLVIYRYCSDTLQSWCNEFPVFNDDIRTNLYTAPFINARRNAFSPLAEVEDDYSFMDIGPRTFIVRKWQEGKVKVIAGIDVAHLPGADQYSFVPLSESCGTVVQVGDRPVFKVLCENLALSKTTDLVLTWVAIALLILSALLFLSDRKNATRFRISSLFILAGMVTVYLWGMSAGNQMNIFSPLLYSGNRFLYSLGAVVVINLLIFLEAYCVYIIRDIIGKKYYPLIVLGILLVSAYSIFSFRDIVINSSISLELYKLESINKFSCLTYLSYLTMLLSIPMLFTVLGFNAFARKHRIIYPVLVATLMIVTVGDEGYKKEKSRLSVVANRLAFDRDLALERRLKSVEAQIAGDMVFASLSMFPNMESSIQNRLAEFYFSRNAREYLLDVYVFNEYSDSPQAMELYSTIMRNGTPIADNSHFLFVRSASGHTYYAGVFVYYVENAGVSRMLVRLESKDTRGNKGYAGIFNITPPGKTTVPPGYSYGHYSGENLLSFWGGYSYSKRMDEMTYTDVYINKLETMNRDGYIHFIYLIGNGDCVILSRTMIPVFSFIVFGIFIALLLFSLMSLLIVDGRTDFQINIHYYRYKLSAVLLVSLTATLLVMAIVSVYFVFKRNEANMQSVMSYKIDSISKMVNTGIAEQSKDSELSMQDLRELIDRAGDESNSDINLYNASGRLLFSTSQVLFRQQMVSGRINGDAYEQIVYNTKRYCLRKESVGEKNFYCMYAPVYSFDGSLLAIICSPYYDENYDFQKDAAAHTLSIISIFAILLMLARFMVIELADRMFKPLSEMSSRMDCTDLDNLEQIQYDGDDEMQSIVQAYNRMVAALTESTRRLAQAERDKALNEMARQVAHEIKNPLTPMKLQLQRIIRLKQKNDPAWQERFDEAGKIILEHIDILTETANEFSSFAKLYSEPYTDIALDRLIQDEISLFDNRENLRFEYIGLENVVISGPKPQLTRVFVNLIGNAVQALEPFDNGVIRVSLHNSVEDGFYDIMVEDSGYGVSEENLHKLFTPNFTTKSGGSGLGLAISRRVLETCGATISYSKSFQLGGACFTVKYPVKPTSDGSRSEQGSL